MTSRPARHAGAAVLALSLLLGPLAACGDDTPAAPGTTTVTATTTTTVTASAPAPTGAGTATTATPTATGSAPATDAPGAGVPTSTVEAQAEPTGEQVFLLDARVAAQDGFDRVVWELEGDGTPGYRIGWTDEPRRDGSGEAVDLPGGATLQVVLIGVGIPPDAPAGTDVYEGPATLSATGTAVVTEVEVGTVFEGQLTGFVGAEQEAPFRVTLLKDPTRVVLDVAD